MRAAASGFKALLTITFFTSGLVGADEPPERPSEVLPLEGEHRIASPDSPCNGIVAVVTAEHNPDVEQDEYWCYPPGTVDLKFGSPLAPNTQVTIGESLPSETHLDAAEIPPDAEVSEEPQDELE